ncbi:hypothetical protein DEJ23_09475 [Curtobacterium sp. MCSS17_008]|uniref:hypothetical protein n=1 Tax=Curtobacterium sp. MCSS17_008 TaxID=2175647 RepID=UPI000DAACDD4|nr:hypothetical protein [Curtobacterium sp. MCSS17_008]PZF56769.1 hypothetical protein DEJ23_09475 [Curtobacterium sp. MCSS17_008]
MTLTSILPSLRASLPDPLDPTLWPACTEATVDDVRVRAVSMQRLATVAGTPCVHTAEQAAPRHRPRGWAPADVCVTVAAVTRVRRPWGVLFVELDAVVPDCAVLAETRLIGRRSVAPVAEVTLTTNPAGTAGREAVLPADVRVGDLVCFPCVRALAHRDVVVP